jgi:hypothetical protein
MLRWGAPQVWTVSQGEAEFKTKFSLVTEVVPLPDGDGFAPQLHVQLKEVQRPCGLGGRRLRRKLGAGSRELGAGREVYHSDVQPTAEA